MARKGLEGFPERCKVLWLFFSRQREETARGRTLVLPVVVIPTSVFPAWKRNGVGELRTAAGGSHRQLGRAAGVFYLPKPPPRVGG